MRQFTGADKTSVAAGWLGHTEERAAFDRHWRHQLLRLELPVTDPGSWSELLKRKGRQSASGLQQLASTATGGDRLGFVVALRDSTWKRCPDHVRDAYRNPADFCLLRMIRVILDRLEFADEKTLLAILLTRDLGIQSDSTAATTILFELDSRAAERIALVAFVDARRDAQFAATELLLQMSLRPIATTAASAPRRPRNPVELPRLPSNVWLEIWDDAYAERHLASLEWEVPDRAANRSARAGRK